MTVPGQSPVNPDPGNVQGMVAYRYEQPHYAVLLFKLSDPAGARAFIRAHLPKVPRASQDPRTLAGPVLNFAFTWAGLKTLLADDPELDLAAGRLQFDFAFTDQTPDHAAVRDQLGFIHESMPENWWDKRFTSSEIHMALYAAFDKDVVETPLAEIRAAAAQAGMHELKVSNFPNGALGGHAPAGGILHFGYRDGITSPTIDWHDTRAAETVNFREFFMGYPSEDYPVSPQSPGPWREFARDGSFACLAWIHQDVATFNRFLDSNAALAPDEVTADLKRDWVAAKLMGRWPDGSPLVRHPHRPPATPDFDDGFGYGGDRDGVGCPLSAHIRVVNVRDQELTFPNQSRFPSGPPRFVRRGFTYGSTLAGPDDDGADRGVIGTFICARINEQFYTALRWMQKTEFCEDHFRKPHTGTMQDGLFGNRRKPQADTTFPIPIGNNEAVSAQLADFIAYKGVAVFFLPSLAGLARLT